jgi:DNA polymerase
MSRSAKIARQHLATLDLLGVDFIPVRAVDIASPPAAPVRTSHELSPRVEPGEAIHLRQKLLDGLQERHERSCPHCTCATGHTRLVFGEGSPAAAVMFVGEAPGEEEDRTGRPFVGRAGKKLDDMIKAMGLKREEVYIANILKSRPPENRTPLPDEVEKCAPFLAEQIRIIQPRVIVALGGPSSKFLLGTTVGITRIRGTWGAYVDGEIETPVMPTYHPAFLLRQYTEENRRKVWSDLQAVVARLAEG